MKQKIQFSKRAEDMLIERKIQEEWVWRGLNSPDSVETGADGNTHYLKAINEHGDCILHIVVNPNTDPNRVVTVFFDRRLQRKK